MLCRECRRLNTETKFVVAVIELSTTLQRHRPLW